jgi:hypothetical protein
VQVDFHIMTIYKMASAFDVKVQNMKSLSNQNIVLQKLPIFRSLLFNLNPAPLKLGVVRYNCSKFI